ncbi:FtsX-like permease family protein [Kitasatospora sp. NPDC004240]
MKLSAWRVALRIARRDALRAKGRSALVVAMVALPVLGVAGADIFYRSGELDADEKVVRTMGRADAEIRMLEQGTVVLQAPDPEEGVRTGSGERTSSRASGAAPQTGPAEPAKPTAEQRRSLDTAPEKLLRELLPPGTVLLPLREGPYVPTSSAQGLLQSRTSEADLTDPVWRGRIDLVGGRAPAADHEIAVTREFLDRAGLRVGDRTSPRGLEAKPYTITGVVEYPGDLRAVMMVARPGELLDALAALPGANRSGPRPDGEQGHWVVKLPGGAGLAWTKVTELNKYGFTAASRAVLLDPPARSDVPFYVKEDQEGGGPRVDYLDQTAVVILATVAGMALLEIVLLAGPAFAVGARRSRRQLGLMAAGGGDRSHIRAVVLGGGVVLGVTGAVVGLVAAIGLVALTRTKAEEYAGVRFGHFDLQPLDLFGVLLIGLVTGLLAAVVPAVQASRQDVVAALTGRDSVKPPSRRLALGGLLTLAAGAAIALLGATSGFGGRSLAVLGGSALAELGMVVLTPFLVGLFGKLGRWLPLGPRLALRDSVRHRGRTAPAVAAVMAAVAGSVAVGVYGASSDEQSRREYVASGPAGAVLLGAGWGAGEDGKLLPQMRSAVETNMPGLGARADIRKVAYPEGCRIGDCAYIELALPVDQRCPAWDDERPGGGPQLTAAERERILREDKRCRETVSFRSNGFSSLVVSDATVLRNLFGATDPAAAQALAAGKVVVFDQRYVKDGKLLLQFNEPNHPSAAPSQPGPPPQPKEVPVDAVFVPAAAPAAGQGVLTQETARRLGLATVDSGSVWLPESMPGDVAEQKASGAVNKIADYSHFEVERGFRPANDLISLGLTGFAALVALGAAGIATGLAAADSQRDLTTLAAVGAAPRIRRTLSGFQCGVIAAMGAILGTVCGLVPAVALRKVEGNQIPYGGMSPEEAVDRTVVVFPWLTMGLTVVVLPLVAVALATLLTRSRISLLRRS